MGKGGVGRRSLRWIEMDEWMQCNAMPKKENPFSSIVDYISFLKLTTPPNSPPAGNDDKEKREKLEKEDKLGGDGNNSSRYAFVLHASPCPSREGDGSKVCPAMRQARGSGERRAIPAELRLLGYRPRH